MIEERISGPVQGPLPVIEGDFPDGKLITFSAVGATMGMTYFKRYRMEIDLRLPRPPLSPLPAGYLMLPWRGSLLAAHAEAKFESFRYEIDANVFACLGERGGCHRLMREISQRRGFLPNATWLVQFQMPLRPKQWCGTIQGVRDAAGFGAVQNLGIVPEHRSRGLGKQLLLRALDGFSAAGLERAYLEVTAQNLGAVRLYERLGFQIVRTVYKAADIAFA